MARKKVVRIKSGHEARFIEKSRGNKKTKKKPKAFNKKIQNAEFGNIGKVRTHKPTVAELVYHFLERASNRGVAKTQKRNVTERFRKVQRRNYSKRFEPDTPPRSMNFRNNDFGDDVKKKPYVFPYSKIPSEEGKTSMEKCIFEVLSFGTVLGLLEPVDDKGMVFRISSDLELIDRQREKHRMGRKRRANFDDHIVASKRRR